MKILLPVLMATAGLLCGCSTATFNHEPGADMQRLKVIFVERNLADNHHLAEALSNELKALGYDSAWGPLTMKPDHVDAVLSYEDQWAWDFKSYLIHFELLLRDNRNDRPIANATYDHASLLTKSPEEIIHEILPKMLKSAESKRASAPATSTPEKHSKHRH